MDIHSFDALVASARSQAQRHLLLLVFVKAVTQAHYNEAEVAGFEAGQGGALEPRMNVAKDPHDVDGFTQLCQEARQMSDDWDMVPVARMAGEDGRPPTPERTDAALDAMVARVQQGADLNAYSCFNRAAEPVYFAPAH